MQHRHSPQRQGRGKYYHLGFLPDRRRNEIRHLLSRHADVCARIGIHHHVAINHSSAPSMEGDGWWVIDQWVGEQTVADLLASGPWPRPKLPRLLLEVALGIQALHAAQVVLRELAPQRILVGDDGRIVLTDFELAKLLDGGPSVSSEWPDEPFRAPELDGAETTPQSDLYSFGRVALAALGCVEADPGQTAAALRAAKLPKRLQGLLLACIEPLPQQRPDSIEPLVDQLRHWQEG